MSEQIHPFFYWIWATLIITALIRLDESLFSLAVIASVFLLIRSQSRSLIRWSTFQLALRLAFLAVLIRMIVAFLIGVPMPGKVIFRLPQLELPDFLVGIRIGGDITSTRLASTFEEVILFAAVIILFGAANSLTTPTKVLRVIPRRLYGVGVVTTLATTLTPQIANSVSRIREAQFLRGQDRSGFKSWRRIGTPVLDDALARSIDLAAALEARGYGIKPRPSRYRPIEWNAGQSVALLPAAYAAILLPHLGLTPLFAGLLLVGAVLTPLVIR